MLTIQTYLLTAILILCTYVRFLYLISKQINKYIQTGNSTGHKEHYMRNS